MTNQEKFVSGAKERGTKESGLTIIELLIAMSVLTVGMVSVVGMAAYVCRTNSDSNTISVLATQVQSELDSLRTATWTVSACDPRLTVGGSLTSNVDSHYKTVSGTSAGNVIVRWQVSQGATVDYRYVSVNAIRAGYPGDVKNGITVTTMINRQ